MTFLQTWLPAVLGPDTFPNPLVIERAHRLRGQQSPNGPPCTIIIKFLKYQDKVTVMRQLAKKER